MPFLREIAILDVDVIFLTLSSVFRISFTSNNLFVLARNIFSKSKAIEAVPVITLPIPSLVKLRSIHNEFGFSNESDLKKCTIFS